MPKPKGPVITIHGMSVRALPSETLAQMKEAWAQELLHWRNEAAAESRSKALVQGELEKAEATVRNQEVELRRLRARVAELESR